jgi:hypothetical protein
LAAAADEESEDEGTPGPAGNKNIHDEWKDVKKYIFDMRDLGHLMSINLELSIKHIPNASLKPNKCDPSV